MTERKEERQTFWEKSFRSLLSQKFIRVIIYIVMSLWSATTIFPLLWVINNSFKPKDKIIGHSLMPSFNPTLANYANAFDIINIGRSYMNSIIMAGGTVVFTLFFAGMAAYVMSRFSFKIRGFLQSIIVMSLLIPPFATVVANYILLGNLGLINTYWGLIIPSTAGNLPFAIFVITAYMSTIPKELEEAAIVDGCGRFRLYTKIFFPLSKPSFATAAVFVFLWTYNDLFQSLIFVNGDKVHPIVVLLNEVSTKFGTNYGLMTVTVVLTAIPVIIVYILLQRYIEKGLTTGAVKG